MCSLERIHDRRSRVQHAKANSLTDMQQHLAELGKEVHRTRRSPWGPQISYSFSPPRMYWMMWHEKELDKNTPHTLAMRASQGE